ncbi:MAG: hypothetical protein WCA92_11900 [Terriglobales bacterium]
MATTFFKVLSRKGVRGKVLSAWELTLFARFRIVDCLTAGLSMVNEATLVTSDGDFEKLGRHFSVLWLSNA